MRRLVVMLAMLLWAAEAQAQVAVAVTPSTSAIRPIAERLPDVWSFLQAQHRDITEGNLASNDALVARARAFYTRERMDAIERVIPGWGHMASYEDGKTLWHVNVAMLALLRLKEYKALKPADRVMAEWIVLLHDLAKEPLKGRDHRHSFRSGALAGRVLPALGFPVTDAYPSDFPAWFGLTDGAFRLDRVKGYPIHDNTKLPEIMAGVQRLFTGPTLIAVKAITLHQSITSLAAWPVAAPISRAEASRYVDAELYPPLLALTLADSGGWNLFDPKRLAAMYRETRTKWEQLQFPWRPVQ